ncbi:hypothetical protein ACLIA0_13665 [Bacillaceae bacterium W0354]
MLKKILTSVLILLLVVSVGFNYKLYQENKDYKMSIGSDYLMTVRDTLFELSSPDNSYWLEVLEEDHGEILIERHIVELDEIARGFSRMNGKVGVLGDYLKIQSRLYSELVQAVNERDDSKIISTQDEIDRHHQFLSRVLGEVEEEFGEDTYLWYQELSNSDSETSNRIWDEIQVFERQK